MYADNFKVLERFRSRPSGPGRTGAAGGSGGACRSRFDDRQRSRGVRALPERPVLGAQPGRRAASTMWTCEAGWRRRPCRADGSRGPDRRHDGQLQCQAQSFFRGRAYKDGQGRNPGYSDAGMNRYRRANSPAADWHFGRWATLQAGSACWCQKQPWTNTTFRRHRKTGRSGTPRSGLLAGKLGRHEPVHGQTVPVPHTMN